MVGVIVAAITGAVLLLPHSKKAPEVFTKTPPTVYKAPHPVKLDAHGRAEVVFVASRFIKTAVRRKHVDLSWDMTDPSLKQGFTKRQWASGNIPVVPYPAAGIRQLQFDWSYRDDVALDIVLVAVSSSHLPPKSFMIELKRTGTDVHHRWRVASWAPHGVSEASMAGGSSADVGAIAKPPGLSSRWLLLPLFLILGMILTVPLFLAVRERLRAARAERTHRDSSSQL